MASSGSAKKFGGSAFTVAGFADPAITTTAESSVRTYCIGYGVRPMAEDGWEIAWTIVRSTSGFDRAWSCCSSNVFQVWKVWRNYRTIEPDKPRFPEIASQHAPRLYVGFSTTTPCGCCLHVVQLYTNLFRAMRRLVSSPPCSP